MERARQNRPRPFPGKICRLVVFAACIASSEALDWKATTLNAGTAPLQSALDAAFEFSNRSSRPVAILDVTTSCSCLLAQPDKTTYAPGESGRISVHFTVGDRGGLYERTVTVRTDEPQGTANLTMRIEVPEPASVTPGNVAWKAGDPADEKTIEVRSAGDLEIVFSRAVATDEAYVARLETVVEGRHYRLHVKPKATGLPVSAAIRLYGKEKKTGREVPVSAYVRVW